MADLRSSLPAKPIAFDERNPVQWHRRTVTLSDLEDGANNVFDVPAEHALVDGFIIPRSDAASGGSATAQVVFNSENFTGAIGVAALAKGEVHRFAHLSTNLDAYVTSDTAVSLTNATAVFTGGVVDVYFGLIKVVDNA